MGGGVWITLKKLPRNQESRERDQKIRDFEDQGSLLRNKAGRRPKALMRRDDKVRAELEPVVAEVEARGATEATIVARIVEFVTRQIHVEFFASNEPFGMRERDRGTRERTESVLVGHKAFAGAARGATPMEPS